MKIMRGGLFLFAVILFIAFASANNLTLVVNPDSPNVNIQYTFTLTNSSISCNQSVMILNHTEIVTTNSRGWGVVQIDIGNLTSNPTNLCEFKDNTLRKIHFLPDLAFNKIYANEIRTGNLTSLGNVSASYFHGSINASDIQNYNWIFSNNVAWTNQSNNFSTDQIFLGNILSAGYGFGSIGSASDYFGNIYTDAFDTNQMVVHVSGIQVTGGNPVINGITSDSFITSLANITAVYFHGFLNYSDVQNVPAFLLSSGNPFNQVLNTTSNATFYNLNISNRLNLNPISIPVGNANAGDIFYNTSLTSPMFYNGSAWRVFGYGAPIGTLAAFNSTCPSGWSAFGDNTKQTDLGGRWVLIGNYTVSGAGINNVILNLNGSNVNYSNVKIIVNNAQPVTNGNDFYFTVNNGSGFSVGTGYYYRSAIIFVGTSSANNGNANVGDLTFGSGVSNAAGKGFSTILTLVNPSNPILHKDILFDSMDQRTAIADYVRISGSYQYNLNGASSVPALSQIKLNFSAGNIANGTFMAYGLVTQPTLTWCQKTSDDTPITAGLWSLINGFITQTNNQTVKFYMNASSGNPPIGSILQSAQGGISAGSDEGWHEVGAASEPTFTNSWVNWGNGNATAAFRKLPSGMVVIKGAMKNGNNGLPAFTLPVGYRPALDEIVCAAFLDGTGCDYTTIRSTGAVIPSAGSVAGWSISTTFFAEQ